jgi:hypothetical protein
MAAFFHNLCDKSMKIFLDKHELFMFKLSSIFNLVECNPMLSSPQHWNGNG